MALAASQLLALIENRFSEKGETVARRWSYPYLTVEVTSPVFGSIEPDSRSAVLAKHVGVSSALIEETSQRAYIQWTLLGPSDPGGDKTHHQSGYTWLSTLGAQAQTEFSFPQPPPPPSYVHFYGFKGGQGRSTALCFLARALANDGWRVLVVDLDSEAPSLDVLVGASANDLRSSVLGIRAGEEPRSISLGALASGGEVRVLPFRPHAESFDLDALALAFEVQAYPPAATPLIKKITELGKRENIHITLIDHRSGLGPMVPNAVAQLEGPTVVCSRLDGQSRHGTSVLRALWSINKSHRGMLLSLATPEETEQEFRDRNKSAAEEVLQALAEGSQQDSPIAEDLNAQELIDHWVVWPYVPELNRQFDLFSTPTNGGTDFSIAAIRRLLRIDKSRQSKRVQKSGALDDGDLITTNALRKLRAENNPYSLIIGRKGTGKTRLVRTLVEEGLGESLLVPTDFPASLPGARAGHGKLKQLSSSHAEEPEYFWYALLIAAVEVGAGDQEALLDHALALPHHEILTRINRLENKKSEKSTFLIDALESAFAPKETKRFVQGLFRVLETIDATPQIGRVIALRLFVRRDLVDYGIQNREQIEEGHRIDLSWDTQTIFNFVLSRIASHEWFKSNFAEVVRRINEKADEVLQGRLDETDCNSLLLDIFPERLNYKNMQTSTFLRTYFSDDSASGQSYYPRVYMEFLDQLADSENLGPDRKIDGTAIVKAHENAARAFLSEVSQELAHAAIVGAEELTDFLDSLIDEKTPFDVDLMRSKIEERSSLPEATVRRIMDSMKRLGIFEEYPKRPNQWRPGRLFKTALRMRFPSRGKDPS